MHEGPKVWVQLHDLGAEINVSQLSSSKKICEQVVRKANKIHTVGHLGSLNT